MKIFYLLTLINFVGALILLCNPKVSRITQRTALIPLGIHLPDDKY
ncbi:hypothetical protein SAMN05444349_10832 [Bacteroides faecichinchillae]|uniref:Uncharacterized protein n=1 Tax=Bacteroides faecichinchillae TaxID=871325 RepID=A0A1M4XDF6_9BACE|nr:hypothetical protein SAMN05444349_10832 [Bacteroides faecichinchillae]